MDHVLLGRWLLAANNHTLLERRRYAWIHSLAFAFLARTRWADARGTLSTIGLQNIISFDVLSIIIAF